MLNDIVENDDVQATRRQGLSLNRPRVDWDCEGFFGVIYDPRTHLGSAGVISCPAHQRDVAAMSAADLEHFRRW